MDTKILITGGSGFIGTNLIDYFKNNGIALINVDVAPPKKASHIPFWIECDILDKDKIYQLICNNQPEIVIHLAAETKVEGKNIEYYKVNTLGTDNLLEAVSKCNSIKRIIITSTQYVYQSGTYPKNDEEYVPLGMYGKSKVITEKITRSKKLNSIWTIIRPTNIWGPWHNIYPEGFWKQLYKGRYLHPGKQKVIRSYGYVGNVVYQIDKILMASPKQVNGKVFYVGDEPINLYDWVNSFSNKLSGKNVKIVPRVMLKSFAIVGDALKMIGIKFPLTTSRFKNMIIENPCNMKKTFKITGSNPFTLEEGVTITANWYLNSYLKKYKC